ncbi:unnamed protein product [marine sediment metagenome]|uniref:Uncharacterized protein n=1 Tax=marine sediment metagenome TaxID=412755 RepID=X1A0Q7_9ZZZZ
MRSEKEIRDAIKIYDSHLKRDPNQEAAERYDAFIMALDWVLGD